MMRVVLESFWLLPGALSCLQAVVIVISVLKAMLYPHTIRAAWRKVESFPLDKVHTTIKEKQESSQGLGSTFSNTEPSF